MTRHLSCLSMVRKGRPALKGLLSPGSKTCAAVEAVSYLSYIQIEYEVL